VCEKIFTIKHNSWHTASFAVLSAKVSLCLASSQIHMYALCSTVCIEIFGQLVSHTIFDFNYTKYIYPLIFV